MHSVFNKKITDIADEYEERFVKHYTMAQKADSRIKHRLELHTAFLFNHLSQKLRKTNFNRKKISELVDVYEKRARRHHFKSHRKNNMTEFIYGNSAYIYYDITQKLRKISHSKFNPCFMFDIFRKYTKADRLKQIPEIYIKASLRCVTPLDHDGFVGLGFNCSDAAKTIRVQIHKDDIARLIQSCQDLNIVPNQQHQ